jgi:hypothetical protein
MVALTRKEKKLQNEIKKIAAAIYMDVAWNIDNYSRESRKVRLEIMRDRLIRSEVISRYTLIDEYLSMIICNYYFRRKAMKENMTYRQLWKKKQFRIFVHYLLDQTFLLKKMELVHAFDALPENVQNAIRRINTVRNAVAHSLFPQNLRRYMPHGKVIYNGVDLFTLDGIEKFKEDFYLVDDFLLTRAFGAKVAKLAADVEP